MLPWFVVTEAFTSRDEAWAKYVAWSGLVQLDEVVSLDPMLCRPVPDDITPSDWEHIVNEDFMLRFFTDARYLLGRVGDLTGRNFLCVHRNPPEPPQVPRLEGFVFEFLGYDLVDVQGGASALTNCGGFPEAFHNDELGRAGLLVSHARALEVQSLLRAKYPREPHAECHVWAIHRGVAATSSPQGSVRAADGRLDG